ncbi:MAG TPA: zf-HC2 domain-containing protein [Phycisphaerae bacterium]|nr:zf-HC2 domain-containing protein [Phycisphaerae bacterium]
MNCKEARKLLYAFADGQLGVKDNCEVLDHLKMCSGCSHVVDEHQALRSAVGRSIGGISVPPSLHNQVASSLPSKATSAAAGFMKPRAFALAAGIVLVAGVALWRSGWLPTGSGDRPVVVEPGNSAATMIAQVHNECCQHADFHQSKDLPTSLKAVGPAICEHYGQTIAALAPDLSQYGYRFESANFCGVQDKPGTVGGHILYVADSASKRMSFFSVPRWDCLDKCKKYSVPSEDGSRKYEVDQEGGGKLCIVAWHNDRTTYICCGPESFDVVEKMVKQVRTAMVEFDRQVRLALATPALPDRP